MKSIVVKLMIVGLLAAGLASFGPQLMPLVNRVFTPPAVHQTKPVLPPPGVKHLQQVENLVFDMTNQARRAKGLPPLSKDDELTNVARAYSDDMLVRRFFDHTTPDGVTFDERISDRYPHWIYLVGENIWSASGYNPGNAQKLAKEIVDDWMSSPGHRENLLDPAFTHLGVGVSARHHTIRATQEFVGKSKAFNLRELFSRALGPLA
jgi:uncharacterized protein YkwD